jgi:uncharacterized delta-60 repeat protein
MQLEGLTIKSGMKIELPAAPVDYYICTFGTNLTSTPVPIRQTYITGTSALVYDTDDNLYVTGTGYNTSVYRSLYQGVTVKFNTSATVDWQTGLSTSSSDFPAMYSINLDSSNNVYVAGSFTRNWQDSTKSPTYQIAKYNSNGALQWQRNLGYGFTSFVPNFGKGLVVEKSTGNFYVTGDIVIGSVGSQTTQMSLIKYNSSGIIQWARQIGRSGTNEHSNAVTLDSTGNVYIAGSTTYSGQNAASIVKYNSSGVLQWQTCLSGTTNSNANEFSGIAIDSSDNIFVCGRTTIGNNILTVGMIAKYNSSGTLIWQRKISNPSICLLYGISTDNEGDVYAVGISSSYSGLVVKYSTSGELQWQRRVSGVHSTLGYAIIDLSSIAFDSSNNMTVGGYVVPNQARSNNDMLILKLPPDGTLTGTYGVNGYQITYEADVNTSEPLTQTPVTSTMTSESVTYGEAGPSTLDSSSTSFVNIVTQI